MVRSLQTRRAFQAQVTGAFLYPAAVSALIRSHLERTRDAGGRFDPLSPRETEVVKLIAEGLTSREIGEVLMISPKTVERHRENVLEKLGLRDRVDITRYAIRRGLVDWTEGLPRVHVNAPAPPLWSVRVLRAAEPELSELARLLRAGHTGIRGVAMLEQLLCSGALPLYGNDERTFVEQLGRIRYHLCARA
jgi:DNA-binding CsgD family transcriptional regulator